MIDVELKNILNDLVNKFTNILNVGLLTDEVTNQLRKNYDKGLLDAEKQFDMNFVRDEQRLAFLQKYTFDNIKQMNEETAEKLRQVISRGILNNADIKTITEDIKKVMSISIERAKVIARTESNRAENMGQIDAARQSGFPIMKEWIGYLDAKTSAVCRALNGKKIPIDDKFVWVDPKGVRHEYDTPPAHPNCRSTLAYSVEIKKDKQ